jgi:hypothetical protein
MNKQQFLAFVRVLMKYLEQKNPQLRLMVKKIVKDCAERNRNRERGYESFTGSLRARLKEVVNEMHWERAELYTRFYIEGRRRGQESGQAGGAPTSTQDPSSNPPAARSAPMSMPVQPYMISNSSDQQQQPTQVSSRPPVKSPASRSISI